MTYVEQAREYRAKIEAVAQFAPDEIATIEPTLYPVWQQDWITQNGSIVSGQIFREGDNLYRAIDNITIDRQNKQPSLSPDLWMPIVDSGQELSERMQLLKDTRYIAGLSKS